MLSLPKNEDIVAIVNDIHLFGKDFHQARKFHKMVYGKAYNESSAFQSTVTNEVCRQHAPSLGVNVSVRDVAHLIDAYKKKTGGNRGLFGTDKPTPAMRREWEEIARKVITTARVIDTLLRRDAPMTEDLMREFYLAHPEALTYTTDRFHVITLVFADEEERIELPRILVVALGFIKHVSENGIQQALDLFDANLDENFFSYHQDICFMDDPRPSNPAPLVANLKPQQLAGPIVVHGGYAVHYLIKHYPKGSPPYDDLDSKEMETVFSHYLSLAEVRLVRQLYKAATIEFPGPWHPEKFPGWDEKTSRLSDDDTLQRL